MTVTCALKDLNYHDIHTMSPDLRAPTRILEAHCLLGIIIVEGLSTFNMYYPSVVTMMTAKRNSRLNDGRLACGVIFDVIASLADGHSTTLRQTRASH